VFVSDCLCAAFPNGGLEPVVGFSDVVEGARSYKRVQESFVVVERQSKEAQPTSCKRTGFACPAEKLLGNVTHILGVL
jgi:hypothetical protein